MTSNIVFGIADYIVFGLMLLFSALVGIYFYFSGGKQKMAQEFLIGNKDMPVIPVAFSIMSSYWSTPGVLGISSEAYLYGFILVYQIIAYFVATPIIIFVYHVVLYNLELTSVNEYLRRRFGKYACRAAAFAFVIQTILYLPMVLFASALTLSTVTGIELWMSVLSMGLVCTFYCTMDGMKAVVWSDFFQVLLMFTTVLVVIVKGSIDVGGFRKVWAIATDGDRIKSPSFKFDLTERYSFWALTVGGTFASLAVNGVNQVQVQKMMTLGSAMKSRRAIYVMQVMMTLFVIGLCLCGIVIYANVGSCDPLLRPNETRVTASDQLLPFYIVQSLGIYPGLSGLFLSGIFSASISNVSSGLNSLAAVTLEDLIKPYCQLTEAKAVLVTKFLVLSYGLICVLLSYFVQKLGVLFQAAVTVVSALGSPVLGLFTLGMLCTRPNEKGAVVGLVMSSVFFLWIGIGGNLSEFYTEKLPQTVEECPDFTEAESATYLVKGNMTSVIADTEDGNVFPLYKLAFFWLPTFGFLLTVLLGYIVSVLTGPNTTVDEELLTPFCRRLYGCSIEEEESVTMEFKHKDSDLVRADARNKISNIPDIMTELRTLREEVGVRK